MQVLETAVTETAIDVSGKRRGKKVTGLLAVACLVVMIALAMAGCGSSSVSGNQTSTPTFSPGGGSYSTSQTVTIADVTQGAVLYCTTDGTTPTQSSPQCGQPTTVFKSEFLQAIAVAPGKSASAVASAGYTINLDAAATPTFSPAGSTYTSTQTVTITDATNGANIFYTTDGSVPTASSTLYTGPIAVATSETLSAIAVASGYSNSGVASAAYTINLAGMPTISSISPTSATAGGPDFTLTVNGTNFDSGATVEWGSTALVTIFVSSTQLTATVPASLIATAGSATVTVMAAGGTSAGATFTISPSTSAVPTISSLSPSSAAAGGADFTLTVNGTNFVSGATVEWGSTALTTTFVSSTQLTAAVPASLIATAGTVSVTVTDSGGTSSGATFTISSSAGPTISSLSPNSATPGGAAFTLTVNGTNFVSGATVEWGSTALTTTFVSATQLTAAVPATLIATAGTVSVTVTESSGTSPGATFTIASGAPTISGTVVSGSVPISGATVQLYAAGQSGYGTGATLLSTTPGTITTDTKGSFSIAFPTCPAAPGDQLYLVAAGGNAGKGTNMGIALMAALGSCSQLASPTTVTVNEVTTVASAYALAAFATVATSGGINVGAPALASDTSCNAAGKWQSSGKETCNYNGLVNSFKTVNSLVDLSTGQARTYTPDYTQSLSSDTYVVNNSTVPQARINALADMLATCVESSGSGCSSGLFAAAKPAGGTAPADTLQAALDIAQNPGNNVTTLIGLVPTSNPPYATTLSSTAAPTDLTLALTFTGGGLGLWTNLPTTSSVTVNGTPFTGVGPTVNTSLAIDAAGNIWVGAFGENSLSSGAILWQSGSGMGNFGGLIAEFNNQGAPLTTATSFNTSSNVVTYGGINLDSTNLYTQPSSIAIDLTGNLWIGDHFDGYLYEYAAPTSGSVPVAFTTPIVGNGAGVNNLAIDQSGNVWAAANLSPGVYEFQNNGTPITLTGAPQATYSQYLVFDSSLGLWVTYSNTGSNDLYQINTTNGAILQDLFPAFQPFGYYTLAADGSGNVYGCFDSLTNLDVFNSSGWANQSAPYALTNGTGNVTGVRGCGNQLVMDGKGNIFAVSNAIPATNFAVTANAIDEFTTTGTLISPAENGYTGTSSTESPTLNTELNFGAAGFGDPVPGISAAVDGSGNLWVLNVDTNGTTSSLTYTTQPGNVLVEYVGIGAPVVTPTSAALSTLGARP